MRLRHCFTTGLPEPHRTEMTMLCPRIDVCWPAFNLNIIKETHAGGFEPDSLHG